MREPTPSDPAQIGARIKEVRQERGWTQDQLAQAVGVSRSAVAQWETGRAGQITGNLTRIAANLEVGVEFLMYGSALATVVGVLIEVPIMLVVVGVVNRSQAWYETTA